MRLESKLVWITRIKLLILGASFMALLSLCYPHPTTTYSHGHGLDFCVVGFHLYDGMIGVLQNPGCPLPTYKVVGARLVVYYDGPTIAIRLPSGWGMGQHTITYVLGDDRAYVDDRQVEVELYKEKE